METQQCHELAMDEYNLWQRLKDFLAGLSNYK